MQLPFGITTDHRAYIRRVVDRSPEVVVYLLSNDHGRRLQPLSGRDLRKPVVDDTAVRLLRRGEPFPLLLSSDAT